MNAKTKERSIPFTSLALAPFVIFAFVGCVWLIAYGSEVLFPRDAPPTRDPAKTLSPSALHAEPPCVKRLLIKRVNDGHLVTGDDVSHAEKVCEQAAALGAAK